MRLRGSVSLSVRALSANKVRAMLALSSVSAGVAAVVLTSALGTGAEEEVRRQIERMGTNLLVARPVQVRKTAARKELRGLVTSLRLEDYAAIQELAAVADAAPGVEAPVRVKSGAAAMMTKVLGTTSTYLAVRSFRLRDGRFLDATDDRAASRVAVLGARVAEALFAAENPVGRQMRIRGVPFDVVGVLLPKGVLADGDEDNQVLVPIRTALRRVFNSTSLNTVFVIVQDPRQMTAAETEIGAVLRERHRLGRDGRPDDFEIQNAARMFALQRQTAASLSLLTTGLGVLALLVGGTGILGLMLMSVKERTSEIGLRMAVGATPRDILTQFLMEATILALAGWFVGLAAGALGAAAVAFGTGWNVGVPVAALLSSLGMALMIGLGFGAFPARKASMTPPIEALLAE
jgi:putative ABC transport system permease protein